MWEEEERMSEAKNDLNLQEEQLLSLDSNPTGG